MSHQYPESGSSTRPNVVRTKVRLENLREFAAYYMGTNSLPEGRIELKYPFQLTSGGVIECACCGGRAQTMVFLTSQRLYKDHVMRKTVHQIPSCEVCKNHQEIGAGSKSWGCLLGLIFGVVMIILIIRAYYGDYSDLLHLHSPNRLALLYLIPILIAGEILLLRFTVKEMDENEQKAQLVLGEKCSGTTFAGFERKTKGIVFETPLDIFWFTNREYAIRFCAMNSGTLE